MVTLTRSDVHPPPPNQVTIKCPLCTLQYRLNYSDDEWHRVKTWLTVAEHAIREDHKQRHEQPSLSLNWTPVRGR
jgi:hypothetical protein